MTTECVGPRDDITESCHRLFSTQQSPYRKMRDNYAKSIDSLGYIDTETQRYGFEALEKMSSVYALADSDDMRAACLELDQVTTHLHEGVYQSAMTVGRINEARLRRKELPFVLYRLTLQNKLSREDYERAKADMETFRSEAEKLSDTRKWREGEERARQYTSVARQLNEKTPSRARIAAALGGGTMTLVGVVAALAGSVPLPA